MPCLITQSFWAEVIKWCSNRGVVINHISAKDILFGKKVHKVGKQYIYNCRWTKTNPCLRVFLARLNNVYQLETIIAKLKNKMSFHLRTKWQALLTGGTQLPINTCQGLVVLILSLCVVCAVRACVSYLCIIFLKTCNVGYVCKN